MTYIKQLIRWWTRWQADRQWCRLRKRYPVLNNILATAWRCGWRCERWDADLADQFVEQIPMDLSEQGAMILDKIRSAYYDGVVEKQIELEDDERCEVLRQARSPSMN